MCQTRTSFTRFFLVALLTVKLHNRNMPCNPEKCPLFSVCKDRLAIARSICDRQVAVAAREIQDLKSTHLSLPTDTALERVGQLLSTTLGNLGLALEIKSENLTQAVETLECTGPRLQRSWMAFGRVVEVTCGNPSRLQRLDGRMYRKEASDESTLEA